MHLGDEGAPDNLDGGRAQLARVVEGRRVGAHYVRARGLPRACVVAEVLRHLCHVHARNGALSRARLRSQVQSGSNQGNQVTISDVTLERSVQPPTEALYL